MTEGGSLLVAEISSEIRRQASLYWTEKYICKLKLILKNTFFPLKKGIFWQKKDTAKFWLMCIDRASAMSDGLKLQKIYNLYKKKWW